MKRRGRKARHGQRQGQRGRSVGRARGAGEGEGKRGTSQSLAIVETLLFDAFIYILCSCRTLEPCVAGAQGAEDGAGARRAASHGVHRHVHGPPTQRRRRHAGASDPGATYAASGERQSARGQRSVLGGDASREEQRLLRHRAIRASRWCATYTHTYCLAVPRGKKLEVGRSAESFL